MELLQKYVFDHANQALGKSWAWFDSLNREEWLIVLAACCLCGFFLMRGFGARRQV